MSEPTKIISTTKSFTQVAGKTLKEIIAASSDNVLTYEIPAGRKGKTTIGITIEETDA